MQALQEIELHDGRLLEFILAVPARRYGEFLDILTHFHTLVTNQERETIDETCWQDVRLVVAHNPMRAKEQTEWRRAQIKDLEDKAARWAGKLDNQDGGAAHRGRKLSDSGAKARFYHEVKEAHLAKIIKVDMQSELFTYEIDDKALKQSELVDGKLLLVTNVKDLTPKEIVQRYKSLADIERGFRVLKSEIEIAPVYHRLPQRIRAHAMICFMALILYRIMRERLKMAKTNLSPERALAQLKRIHRHQIKVNDRSLTGVSTLTKDQTNLLGALTLKKPTKKEQLSLL
jgi:transposase